LAAGASVATKQSFEEFTQAKSCSLDLRHFALYLDVWS